MMKKVLLVLMIVVISSITVQTGAAQDQPDLRLEHADVPMYPQLARTARISAPWKCKSL